MSQKQCREISLNNLSSEDACAISEILTHAFQIVGAWDAEHGNRLDNLTWAESDIELGRIKAIKQTLLALQNQCDKKAEEKGYYRGSDDFYDRFVIWCSHFQHGEAKIV